MKYCAKCGTQMSDDTIICPKCHPEINNQPSQIPSQSTSSKNSNGKIIYLILVNIIISALTLIAVAVMCFIAPSLNDKTNNGNSDNNNIVNSTCPASEYGNHDWAPARCTEPAQCYNCDAYRDDKLGEHSFYTDDDGFCDCTYCGILYDVYIDSLN